MIHILSSLTLIFVTVLIAQTYVCRRSLSTDHPNAPITVPYIFPWIGSLFKFHANPLKFFEDCYRQYGYVYKVVIAGRTLIVISHPDGISSLTRDSTTSLTHRAIFMHMLRGLSGISSNQDLMYDLLDVKVFPLVKMSLSPSNMCNITETFDQVLLLELQSLVGGDGYRNIRLLDIIGIPLYRAGCYTLFGDKFPLDSLHDFQEFDSHLPQLLTNLPFIGRRGSNARSRLLSKIIGYIDGWWDSNGTEDIPGASSMVMQSLTDFKAGGLTKPEAAGGLLFLIWGFHSNTWFMLFWLMTHLLSDKVAMDRLVEDINTHTTPALDEDMPSCHSPLLESTILETFRWATTATTVRYAEADTEINVNGASILIKKGEYIFGDVRAVHHDLSAFDDPDMFKFDRYLSAKGGTPEIPRPMPWGSGKHMCVGRHIAVHMIHQFVFHLLKLYNIKPEFPESLSQTPPSITSRLLIVGSLQTTDEANIPIIASTRHSFHI